MSQETRRSISVRPADPVERLELSGNALVSNLSGEDAKQAFHIDLLVLGVLLEEVSVFRVRVPGAGSPETFNCGIVNLGFFIG